MYRGFIKEITNLAGQPIGNADLRVRNISIRRDILTSASSEFEVLGIPEQAKEGNVFGCYDEYGKIIYLGVITNIDDNTIQTNQIISLFNDKWLYNRPSTITEVIGTSSSLKTIEAPIEITRLNGNTTQNGSSGKNLQDLSLRDNLSSITFGEVTLDYNATKFRIHGTATASGGRTTLMLLKTSLTQGTYTISAQNITGTIGTLYGYLHNSSHTIIGTAFGFVGTTAKTTVTITESGEYYIGFNVTSGNMYDVYFNIQLEKGSTATAYEPHISPTNPQVIQNVSGDNEIKVVGKNLLDSDLLLEASGWTKIDGVYYGSNGTLHTKWGTNTNGIFNTFIQGERYTFSFDLKQENPSIIGTLVVRFYYSDNTYDGLIFTNSTNEFTRYTLTSTSTTKTLTKLILSFGNQANIYLRNLQIEIGSTRTDYEPYKEISYPVNLGSIELNQIGSYKDYIYKSGDKWYLHKAITKVDLGTLDSWNSYNDTFYANLVGAIIAPSSGVASILCTSYRVTSIANILNKSEDKAIALNNGQSRCNVYDSSYTASTIGNFINSVKGVYLYYPLATPTNTEITDTTLINQLNALSKAHSYDGVTNVVQSNSGVGFNLQFNYSKSADTIEQAVEMILQSDFQNNRDSLMQTIFSQFDIDIDSSGTYLTLPSQKENYVMNFMEFIFQLYENYQILLDIDIKYNATRPSLTILKPSYPTLKLSNNNNSLQNFNVMTETYETNKLVLYSREGTLRGIWYGTENGITTNANADRLPKIKTNIVFSDDPAEDIIADNLSNQMYNHKIELDLVLNNKLYNFDDFKLGQTFEIHYGGKTYDSVLTGYEIKINENGTSDIVNLVFGIVRVSLVDKLNRLIVDADSDTASYSTQAKEDSQGNNIAETYETKDNANATYETKDNASATYETKDNASSTYETKTNANSTYVKKSGDTMTGQLLSSYNGNNPFVINASAVNLYDPDGNNGLTSNYSRRGITIRDSNNLHWGYIVMYAGTNGRTTTYIGRANRASASTSATGRQLGVSVNKDGTVIYNISHKAEFRKAIELDTQNLIGTRQYIGTSINNFTASTDGLLVIMYKKTGSNGVWYHYCTVDGEWVMQFSGYTNVNFIDTRVFPLKKGQVIADQGISGATIQTANFYPLAIG